MSLAVPNIDDVFKNQNWHLDEINEDNIHYSPRTHQQPYFVEMRNVTPTRITNKNLNFQSQNNDDTIPPIENNRLKRLQVDLLLYLQRQ